MCVLEIYMMPFPDMILFSFTLTLEIREIKFITQVYGKHVHLLTSCGLSSSF